MKIRHDYWVIRYVPRPARGEFVNVGIVVGHDRDWVLREIPDFARAADFGGHTVSAAKEFMAHLTERITRGDLGSDAMEAMRTQMCNLVQLSAPLPVLGADAGEAAELIFGIFLGPDTSPDVACPRCGATQKEIDAARIEGNAKFYVPCGCDWHGDHGGCDEQCQKLGGCAAELLHSERDTACDHTTVAAGGTR